MIEQSPITVILEAMKQIASEAKMGTALGLESEFLVRHFRNRRALASERPSLSVIWKTADRDEGRQSVHTSSEICWAAEVVLEVDLDLPPADDDATETTLRSDLTGWDILTTAAFKFANLFLDPDGPMIGYVVDDIIPGQVDPDEDSKPDQGRLAIALIVLYRTAATDLMRLLNAETNA